jgi:hypothetical protein
MSTCHKVSSDLGVHEVVRALHGFTFDSVSSRAGTSSRSGSPLVALGAGGVPC